jgi:transposase
MHIEPRSATDATILKVLIRRERNAKQRDRYRVVLLALSGRTAPQIAGQLDRSRRFVQQWAYRYRDGGLENLTEQPRSGKPPKLRRTDEAAFKARLEAGPRPADGVCTFRGRDVQRILKEEFGVEYTLMGAYDLLHRLGFSCLRPRPRHRQNDPQAMAQWVAEAPLLSTASRRSIRSVKSKSGSRTRAASDNRAR